MTLFDHTLRFTRTLPGVYLKREYIVNAQNRIILCSVNNGKEIALPCPLKPQTMQ
jgi:hypothetical protein